MFLSWYFTVLEIPVDKYLQSELPIFGIYFLGNLPAINNYLNCSPYNYKGVSWKKS